MNKKEIDIDFVEKMALKTLHPEILRDAKVFASGNVLDGKYNGFERFQIARHNFLYGAMAAKSLDKKIKEKSDKRKLEVKNELKPLSIHGVVFSEAELKAKLEEQKEEIRQWLIDEDFEGLAERL